MGVAKISVKCQCPAQLRDRFVVSASNHQGAAKVRINDQRKRIQFDGAFTFFDRFVKPAKRHK